MWINKIKIYCLVIIVLLSIIVINNNVNAMGLNEKIDTVNIDLREEYGDDVREIVDTSILGMGLNEDLIVFDFKSAISDPNNELRLTEDYTDTFGNVGGFIVYGEPHGDFRLDRNRFLGYDVDGNQVSNPFFPDDSRGSYSKSNIVGNPWLSDIIDVRLNAQTTDNNNSVRRAEDRIKYRFRQAVLTGIQGLYGNDRILIDPNWKENHQNDIYPENLLGMDYPWEENMAIFQLPSKTTAGLARMWRTEESNVFYTTIIISPFQALSQPQNNFSTIILRTGTEEDGGVAIKGKEYEAVIEYTLDSLVEEEVIPRVTFKISNGTIREGSLTLTKSDVKQWNNNSNTYKHLPDYRGNISQIDWANNLPFNKQDNGFRTNPSGTAQVRMLGTTLNSTTVNGHEVLTRISQDENQRYTKRYLTVRWIANATGTVKMYSKINLDNNFNLILPETDKSDNTDMVFIQVTEQDGVIRVGDYILDYDVLKQDFRYNLNSGNAMTASISKPSDGGGYRYYWSGNTSGQLNVNIRDNNGLISNVKNSEIGSLTGNERLLNSISRRPYITWTTTREVFGDNPVGKNFAENTSNPVLYFDLDTHGSSIERRYEIYRNRVVHTCRVGSPSCGFYSTPDEEDSEPVWNWYSGHSQGSQTWAYRFNGSSTATNSFSPLIQNEKIGIQALTYNGRELQNQMFYEGEQNTGNNRIKQLVWEGSRYNIPVVRYMREVDLNGKTARQVAVDGKYDRIFQSQESVTVTYGVNKSLRNHFVGDRQASLDRSRNRNLPIPEYKYAPFATDNDLQNLEYPLKAGYFYVPHGEYTATVRTISYKRVGEQTQHDLIVQSVKDSFRVTKNLPMNDRDYRDVDNIPVGMRTEKRVISNTQLSYETGPDSSKETDILFKRILEGWPETADILGRNSFKKYKYREYVKSSDMRRIEEETVITFILNPHYEDLNERLYTDENTPDGDYNIGAYFLPFSSGNIRTSGNVNIDSITVNIRGSRFDDLYVQEIW